MTSIPASRAAISALKIEQRVECDVKAGIPEINRDSHTESEESLRSYVAMEIIGKAHQGRQAQMDEQVQTRNAVDIRQLYQDMKSTDLTIGKELTRRFLDQARELRRTAGELSRVRADLEIFRHRNGLTREALYRESRILHYSIIFFIVILETALNSVFLSRGSELGLVGGFFQALIISLVNLGFAAFAAFALRNCFHRNPLRKLFGAGLFAGIGLIAGTFVLAVGHYREALALDPLAASGMAIANLQSAPLAIHDFNSWIMVIVSGIAVILLLVKLFVADDRYPGYAAITRRFADLQAHWAELCSGVAEDINTQGDAARKEVAEKEKEIRSQFIAFKSSIERSEEIRSHYEDDIVKAQDLLDELVRHYQSHSMKMMNRRAAYFGELLRFELDKLPKLNATGLEQHKQDLVTFEQIVGSLDATYADAVAAINSQCAALQQDMVRLVDGIEREKGLGGL